MSSSKYGLVIKRIPINSNGKENKSFLEIGTLLQLQSPLTESERLIRFTIKDYCQNDANDKNELFNQVHECQSHYVMRVSEKLWPYVIAIPISERTKFLNDKDKINFVLSLEPHVSKVSVDGEFFHQKTNYECIVRYIGMVTEMSKGFMFALEILVSFLQFSIFECFQLFLNRMPSGSDTSYFETHTDDE